MNYVLITGANSDIGFVIAKAMHNYGYNLILTDVESKLEEVKNKLLEIDVNILDSVIIEKLDLTEEKISDKFKKLIEDYKIHSLINVAGINILKNFLDWNEEEIQRIITINATNTLLLTQYVSKNMISNNINGNIIFISSQHGIVANYDRVPYSLSKAILIQMTKSLALELSAFKIRVNCISPTFVITSNNRDMLNEPYFIINALEEIPLKKYVKPEDIMEAVMFLISKKSNLITGHNLVIDGGWTIK